jgi:hypothetical protein
LGCRPASPSPLSPCWTTEPNLAELKPRRKRDGAPITVRVIEYSITSTAIGKGTTTSEVFCLITNLLDPADAPAAELAGLHARRWKIELVFKAVKVDIAQARPVLRSGHADTVLAGAAITTHTTSGGEPIEILTTLIRPRPPRTADRKRKARQGQRIKTFRVTYKIVPHPMTPRLAAQPRAA